MRMINRCWCLLLLLVLLAACASVPLSGRRQLRFISESKEKSMGEEAYREIFKKTPPLDAADARTKRVRDIGERLAAVSGQPDFQWEFNVIGEDKTINAFCLPGGKVAVFTGILPVAADDAQLATVMGHEIGHAIAHHGAERMSHGMLAQVGGQVLATAVGDKTHVPPSVYSRAYNTGAAVGFMLPFSRKHEEEADYIGLILMSKAGYDPKSAKEFWENMLKQSEGKHKEGSFSNFMSTHPSDRKRISNMQRWLPEAEKYYQASSYRK